jgi:hypothetical protein
MWDRHVLPNPHVFSIYLQLILALRIKLERFYEVNTRMTTFEFSSDGHYHWLKGLINPFSMEQRAKYLIYTICQLIEFL